MKTCRFSGQQIAFILKQIDDGIGGDDRAWWAHTPGDPEGVAAFFVALSRAKQRAIFAFCQQQGQRNKVAELYQLLTAAGVPEIAK